jgi:simple sugar transport system substrate-binding protein/ribose transport system substrate-binding protein
MKKLLIGLLAGVMLFSGTAQVHAIKLGIVAFQMSAETHARVANAASEAAKKKGWEVTVLNSRGSTPDHAAQVSDLVQSNVDAILLAMGKVQQLEEALKKAKAKGIPIVTVSSGTSPYTLFDVTSDEFAVGAKIATYFLGRLNYRGNILMQRYERHVGTRIRGKMMDVELSEYTAVKKLAEHTMARSKTWRNDVRQGMEALLLKYKGDGIDGIWASFDAQGFIIDDLLQQMDYKKGDLILVGIDGEQETFRRIRSKESLFTATIALPFHKMAVSAVDALEQIIVNGKKKEDIVKGPFLFMEPILVDENNVPPEGEWPR